MAYFIHNKYDSNSSAKVTHVSGTSYTYKEDPGVTVIDFFGNMEAGVNTYRNLDTTYMGIKPVDELTYTTIDEDSLIGNGQTTDGASNLEYATGILPIVEKLQEITGQASDTGGSESVGTIMAKLNLLINKLITFSPACIKKVQKGSSTAEASSITVNIQPVDINKSFIIAHGYGRVSSFNDTDVELWFPWGEFVSSNQIKVGGGDRTSPYNDTYTSIKWQVIEFY